MGVKIGGCITRDHTAAALTLMFQGSFFVLSYFLPLVLIVCLYSVMLHTLWYKVTNRGVNEISRNRQNVWSLVRSHLHVDSAFTLKNL